MARKLRSIPLDKVLDYCLESENSDCDSCVEGLSSDEEDELDNLMLGDGTDVNKWYVFLQILSIKLFVYILIVIFFKLQLISCLLIGLSSCTALF